MTPWYPKPAGFFLRKQLFNVKASSDFFRTCNLEQFLWNFQFACRDGPQILECIENLRKKSPPFSKQIFSIANGMNPHPQTPQTARNRWNNFRQATVRWSLRSDVRFPGPNISDDWLVVELNQPIWKIWSSSFGSWNPRVENKKYLCKTTT